MAIKRKQYLDDITDALATLTTKVQLDSAIRFRDINISSETFYKDLLNLVFGYQLQDLNIIDKMFPAIDLGDTQNKIAFQITADSKRTKIKKTLDKFISKKLNTQYEKLIVYVIVNKQKRYSPIICGGFDFNIKKDVWDNSNLMEKISVLGTEKLAEISAFLKREIPCGESAVSATSIDEETRTIIDLIEYLTKNKTTSSKLIAGDPDPKKKIFKRFKGYSQHLFDELKIYIPQYKDTGERVEAVMGLDTLRIAHISQYLRVKSIEFLESSDGDPRRALTGLVGFFSDALKATNKCHDHLAIRYYLLNHMIKCNVFPNEGN